MATNSEKKEKSLAEFIVIVALIGVLMAVFINFYLKNESKFMQAGFATVAQTFNTKVNAVHAQWLMDKKPTTVYLASLNNKQKQAIPVNKSGWIDAQHTQLPCEAIWQFIMENLITETKLPVSAIEVHTVYNEPNLKQQGQRRECRYVLVDGSYFQYNQSKGKVSKVSKQRE